MLFRPITYTTHDNPPKTVTKTFCFHLSKREIIRYAAKHEGGIKGMIDGMIKETSEDKILQTLEDLVLMSYGERSEDGEEFDKSSEVVQRFRNHAAYDALFDEFMESPTTAGAMADFLNGIFPPDMVKASEEAIAAAGGDVQKALEAAAATMNQPPTEQTSQPATQSFT